MKKTIFVLILLVNYPVFGQTAVPVQNKSTYFDSYNYSGKYFKDVNNVFGKFLGTWIYQNRTEIVEIQVLLKENNSMGNYFQDHLYIRVKHTKNGRIVFNSLLSSDADYMIFGVSFRNPRNTNKYHLLYQEPSMPNGAAKSWLDITYFSSLGQPRLKWELFYEPLLPDAVAPTLPFNMILSKPL